MLNKGIEATLLSKEEIGKSKVLQKVGAGCGEPYWTSTPSVVMPPVFSNDGYAKEFIVTSSGNIALWDNVSIGCGVRPVLKSYNLKELIKECKSEMVDDIQIIEYGEFPHLLEIVKIDKPSLLQATGKEYILLQSLWRKVQEYAYNGQKVVKKGRFYYPVKPIKWYVDEESNMLISQDVIFDAPLHSNCRDYKGYIETTDCYTCLNGTFLKQLLESDNILNKVGADNVDDITQLEREIQSKKDKINQLEALLTRQERLQAESAELDAKIAELTQSLNQKRKAL